MSGINRKTLAIACALSAIFLAFSAVADPGPPSVQVSSPANRSYNNSALSLNFSVSGGFSGWCAYSLNSAPNATGLCGRQSQFNDSSQSVNITFSLPENTSGAAYVRLQKNSTVVSAGINITGLGHDSWKNASRPATTSNIKDVELYSSAFGFAVGDSGVIFKWNGTAWENMSSPVSTFVNDLSIYNSTLAFGAVGNATGGYVIKWNGSAWSLESIPDSCALLSVDFANGSLAFAGDQCSRLYKWNGSWYNETSPFSVGSVYGMTMLNGTFGFSGASTKIIKWNGTSWSNFQDLSGGVIRKMEIYNSTYGFAGKMDTGGDNELVGWNGTEWYVIPTSGTGDLLGVCAYGSRAFVVGANGRIVRCEGFSCSEETYSPLVSQINSIDMSQNISFGVGNGGTMIKNPAYSENLSIDIADSGAPAEWSFTGELNSSQPRQNASLDVSVINQFLSSCTPVDGFCELKLNLTSAGAGIAGLSGLYMTYTANTTITGSEGSNLLMFYANSSSGEMNTSSVRFTVDLTSPSISSVSVAPKVVINGTNMTFFVSSSDSTTAVNYTWASVALPGAGTSVIPVTNNGFTNFTTSVPGRYNATFFANDSAGNQVNATGYYFFAQPSFRLNVTTSGFNGSVLNGSVTLYYPDTGDSMQSFSFSGNISEDVPNYVFDVGLSAFSQFLAVRLNGVNVSQFFGSNITIDRLDTPVSGYLNTYGINMSFNVTNATVTISYNSTNLTNENYLGFYRCGTWNLTNRSCSGSWTNVTGNSTQNNISNTFSVNVTGFSGFAIKQEAYCGDSVKNLAESCDGSDFGGLSCASFGFTSGSLSCSAGCAIIATGCNSTTQQPGSGSPGGGAYSGIALNTTASRNRTSNQTARCTDMWNCSEWEPCTPEGNQTRICTYKGNCTGGKNKNETQACNYTAPEAHNQDICGNGACELNENEVTCLQDCGRIEENVPSFSLEKMIAEYWWALAAVPILAVLGGAGLFAKRRAGPGKGKMAISLDGERKHIQSLTKAAQEDYYQNGFISKQVYDMRVQSYNERLSDISKREVTIKESKKDEGAKKEKTPEECEKEVMLKIIKFAQEKYYKQGSITKDEYELRVRAAKRRLAELGETEEGGEAGDAAEQK